MHPDTTLPCVLEAGSSLPQDVFQDVPETSHLAFLMVRRAWCSLAGRFTAREGAPRLMVHGLRTLRCQEQPAGGEDDQLEGPEGLCFCTGPHSHHVLARNQRAVL